MVASECKEATMVLIVGESSRRWFSLWASHQGGMTLRAEVFEGDSRFFRFPQR